MTQQPPLKSLKQSAPPPPSRQRHQRIVLGEIIGAHGLDGEVRIRFASDGPETLLATEAVWVGSSANDPEARRYRVHGCGLGRKGEVRLTFDGVEGRDAIGRLVGLVVAAPASDLPALPEGEFYWYELIGCRVASETGLEVGIVREIWETGAHDILVVEDEDGVRRLLPTAAELMKNVDLDAGRIVVADLPGLLEPV
ncbi:MAG TPA: 16S rRNA processing protein RimM [Myxococcales bacterium]|nr:16S rRNA processing protein RimM [Myxococcales bacterium]HIK86633.1 16S rRNA processing protein RimM [Myxococcales bacterium]